MQEVDGWLARFRVFGQVEGWAYKALQVRECLGARKTRQLTSTMGITFTPTLDCPRIFTGCGHRPQVGKWVLRQSQRRHS